MVRDSMAARLRLAMATRGLTSGKLSKRLGVGREVVDGWLAGELMTCEQFVAVLLELNLRSRWLALGVGMMDARLAPMQRETVDMLFESLPPEALEIWIRCGVLMLAGADQYGD